MAEIPERIKSMFITKEINKSGIYLMTFWINGIETPVIVDDYFPCKNNQPCFSSSDTQEIWAMLLEKAWAKLYGTYARTEGGTPSFASVHLQGVPSWSITHADLKTTDEREKFWYMIKSMDSRQFTMMASSLGQGENESATGIISGHAYSLIGVYEFMHQGQNVRLCKLRNPWGSGEWKGDWSDNSAKWTPALRERFGIKKADDGEFSMPWDAFLSQYRATSVCMEENSEKYKHSQLIHDFNNSKFAFFGFSLKNAIDLEVLCMAISVS